MAQLVPNPRIPILLVLATSLLACGATPPPVAGSGDGERCDTARQGAADAWTAVATDAHAAAAAPDAEAPAIERAVSMLELHLESLSSNPRETSGEVAMAISSAMMDGIDELGGDIPGPLREQADDAAEQLLTDRSIEGGVRATRGAIAVLERVVSDASPASAELVAARRAAAELARRADRAREGYSRSVQDGDRFADRAEAAPIPSSTPALESIRGRAAEASASAREMCGVPRTLSTPTL